MIWMLLHPSVLFFFVGLVDFFLLIGDKTIAWVFPGYIVSLVLVYITTTLLLDSH
jgi:hypothetical protein